jgi:hypothetical protein
MRYPALCVGPLLAGRPCWLAGWLAWSSMCGWTIQMARNERQPGRRRRAKDDLVFRAAAPRWPRRGGRAEPRWGRTKTEPRRLGDSNSCQRPSRPRRVLPPVPVAANRPTDTSQVGASQLVSWPDSSPARGAGCTATSRPTNLKNLGHYNARDGHQLTGSNFDSAGPSHGRGWRAWGSAGRRPAASDWRHTGVASRWRRCLAKRTKQSKSKSQPTRSDDRLGRCASIMKFYLSAEIGATRVRLERDGRARSGATDSPPPLGRHKHAHKLR